MKTVFINGCFDVLHLGHIRMFEYAKKFGDHLVVAIDSDYRISKNKGSDRPFNKLKDRIEFLHGLKNVDEVKSFETDLELKNIIKKLEPDYMIVGSDWEGKNVIGSCYAKKLIFFRRINGYSTTEILKHTANR